MREIKFRIWDPKHKEMLGYFTPENLMCGVFPTGLIDYPTYYDKGGYYLGDGEVRKDLVFLQYTGMKDKYGKEIYEGDIVKSSSIFGLNNNLGYVGYFNTRFLIRTDDIIIQDFNEPEFECVIVGNKYENPELLENK